MTIKGTKSGIILVLDPNAPFVMLLDEMALRFKEASSFLGKNRMGLMVRGRALTEDEESQILEVISKNSELTIVCILQEDSPLESRFVNSLDQNSNEAPVDLEIEAPTDNEEATIIEDNNDAVVYSGNLRSGQDISCKKSVVVLGDVKPGANVTSYGNIFILGELRGNAFAGANGDRNAIVMALDLNPLQVRIADAIAISPDADNGPKLRIKRKKARVSADNEPEVAYIENGHIVKMLYGSSFLRQFYKI